MKINAEQFVFWLEGFIQTSPGVTEQSRKAIQAKIESVHADAPQISHHRIGDVSSYTASGVTTLPVFVAQSNAERHFPHIGNTDAQAGSTRFDANKESYMGVPLSVSTEQEGKVIAEGFGFVPGFERLGPVSYRVVEAAE